MKASTQWNAFVRRLALAGQAGSLNYVIELLARFLMPPAMAAATDDAFNAIWRLDSGWTPTAPAASSPD